MLQSKIQFSVNFYSVNCVDSPFITTSRTRTRTRIIALGDVTISGLDLYVDYHQATLRKGTARARDTLTTLVWSRRP